MSEADSYLSYFLKGLVCDTKLADLELAERNSRSTKKLPFLVMAKKTPSETT